MMIDVLISRKDENGKNTEFKIRKQNKKGDKKFYFQSQEPYYLKTNIIIENIEKRKIEYYTLDNNGNHILVKVEGGNHINKYLSSKANSSNIDNIGNLPKY